MSGPRSKRLLLGKGHARKKSTGCPLFALLLAPVAILLSFFVRWEPPPDGHLGDRHLKAPPEGQWHVDRDGGLPADQQGGNPDHTLRTNLEDS